MNLFIIISKTRNFLASETIYLTQLCIMISSKDLITIYTYAISKLLTVKTNMLIMEKEEKIEQ
jgi:hypothetical protein